MPVFMKIDGIDSVGRQESVKDGTSNTLMIGEHVLLASVSHATTDQAVLDALFYSPETAGGGVSVLEFSVENFPNNSSVSPGEWICDVTYEKGTLAHGVEADDGGIIINWFPTETIRPVDGAHVLYDLVI
jgi:hypothetical protein